jgi:hypothetical protein
MISRRAILSAAAAPLLAQPRAPMPGPDDEFLEDLSRRAFLYFWERASTETGLVLDRALNSERRDTRNVASSAATGFGLTALCIAAERQWMNRAVLLERAKRTLSFYASRSVHEHGWFYHFIDADSGARVWKCELSSIDTALLLCGVLAAKQYFRDPELSKLADAIYARIDWRWMLNGDPYLLSMGWKPESGFLESRWDHHCELMLLYLLGIGSSTTPLPKASWNAWRRPKVTYAGRTYISGAPPLFVHQYSQAWVDFRGRREQTGDRVNWFENSVAATYAHRGFCIDLGRNHFPGCYDEQQWGITASDSAKGYVAWGGPPRDGPIDGTLVPCAAGGSLMFEPNVCTATLMHMRERYGSRVWNRYGFPDAFHPVNGWTDQDVIGIDVGITLLSAENARTGRVWTWFMANPEVRKAMDLAGLASEQVASPHSGKS